MPPTRRIRDRETGEVFTMPWESDRPPTPDDIDLYRQQQDEYKSSWKGRLTGALTAGRDAAARAAQGIQNDWNAGLDLAGSVAENAPTDLGNLAVGVGKFGLGMGKMMITPPVTAATEMGYDLANQTAIDQAEGRNPTGSITMAGLSAVSPIPVQPAINVAKGLGYASHLTDTPVSPEEFNQSLGEVLPAAALAGHGAQEWYKSRNAPKPITDPARLLPAAGETGARFYAGDAGIADATQPYASNIGDLANPFYGPEDLRPDQPVSPVEAAHGRPHMPPRANRNQGPRVDTLQPESIQSEALQGPDLAGQGRISIEGLGGEPAAVGDIQPPPAPYDPRTPVGNQLVQGFQEGRVPTVEPPGPAPTDVMAQPVPLPDITDPTALPPATPPGPYVEPTTGRPGVDTSRPYPVWRQETIDMGYDPSHVDQAKAVADAFGEDITRSDDLHMFDDYMTEKYGKPYTDMVENQVENGVPPPAAVNREAPAPPQSSRRIGNPFVTTSSRPAERVAVPPPQPPPEPAPEISDPFAALKGLGQEQAPAPTPAPAPAPVAEAPKPAGPKKVAKATPDRVLRIARGQHDPIRVIFPDKLHADLFSAVGRFRKATRGEKGIPADYKGLAKSLGVDEKTAIHIAQDYRVQVLHMVKDMPKTFEGGLGQMDAPRVSQMAPAPAVEAPAPAEGTPASGAAPDAQLAKIVADKIAAAKARPPSKAARAKAVVDQIAAQGPEAVQAALKDPAAIAEHAKQAGLSPEGIRQALLRTAKEQAAAAAPKPVAETPKVTAPVAEAPKAEAPTAPKAPKGVKTSTKIQAKIDELDSEDVRGILADEKELNSTAKEIGVRPSALRTALKKFMREEEGSVRIPSWSELKKGAGKAFDAANVVRMTGMLSGLALPKSLAGDIGAHFTAALEGKTLEPIKVLGNVRAILRDVGHGWTGYANPAQTGGFGKVNLPGRAMGAFDYAAMRSLERAGLTEADAKELLLTAPNPISAWKALDNPLGKLFVPFRKTPFNQFGEGLSRWRKHPDVYAGAVLAGVVAGTQIKDKEKLALTSAFAGPYALPFLIGASFTHGASAVQGISPIPEWGITKTITDPFGAINEPPARRWFRSNLGFGKQAEKEKKRERPLLYETSRPKRQSSGGFKGFSSR